ncbi:SGNH/GDSL hydrolase family protein [Anaerostipes sp.]|uniref:SGNH/GDSL hydrolase family protein n=1 Tax=Anaerostipes sp. TaxID=1872530 RepID=UPI00258BC351|nr:SGNH/GDSL hydrolase family protein [Anaerostipes sp.]MCI5623734.1 GDSL-type esterase/lipase family protein [Anaerostipes sp.]
MKHRLLLSAYITIFSLSCFQSTVFASDSNFVSYEPTADNVKQLGRTYYNGQSLWFSLTDSGIEYQFTGTSTQITLSGDNCSTDPNFGARIAIFADGVRVKDFILSQTPQTVTVDLPEYALHTIRVVKLSESLFNSILIDSIAVNGDGIATPTENNAHKIEFIGDSITCGYGMDYQSPEEGFLSRSQDGTRTYAYKAAQKLDADYSMVCFSGYSVLSIPTSAGCIADVYDKTGYTPGGFINEETIGDIPWDFEQSPTDLVVINLGTNDADYTKDDEAKRAEFKTAYYNFLTTVREKNPNADILCTIGMMGQDLYDSIASTVEAYKAETGDTKINTLLFDIQDIANDGVSTDNHPSEKTNTKAAEKLISTISELYNWNINENIDISASETPLYPTYE